MSGEWRARARKIPKGNLYDDFEVGQVFVHDLETDARLRQFAAAFVGLLFDKLVALGSPAK